MKTRPSGTDIASDYHATSYPTLLRHRPGWRGGGRAGRGQRRSGSFAIWSPKRTATASPTTASTGFCRPQTRRDQSTISAAAEEAYNAAFERAISKEKQRLSPVALEVATFFLEQQQPEKAEGRAQAARWTPKRLPAQAPGVEIPLLMRLREVDQSRRNFDLVPVETRLVKAWESQAGPESVVVANNLYYLSGSLEQTGQFTEAEKAIQRGIAILEKTYGRNACPQSASALGRLASIETRLGKDDLAKESRDRESAIRQRPSGQSVYRVGGGVSAPRVRIQAGPRVLRNSPEGQDSGRHNALADRRHQRGARRYRRSASSR